jgi:hypothetical protein
MAEAREELIHLVQQLPEDQVRALLADARRRADSRPTSAGTWPPAFFGSIKRDDLPTGLARNHRKHLAELGFGEDFRG